jgi:hypothetical protein
MVFQISSKIPREKGRAAQWNPIQPFLITIVQWYSEFLASKAVSNTTVFSPIHHTFRNKELSSIYAELYTDPSEMKAICELIGLQGIQFFDEKITRMIANHVASLKVELDINSIRYLSKKIYLY